MDKLLLEDEVAERLRCSCGKVKRLRLSGKLTYIPGRPVLIAETDLEAYLESVRQLSPVLTAAEQRTRDMNAVAERARKKWLMRKWRADAKMNTNRLAATSRPEGK